MSAPPWSLLAPTRALPHVLETAQRFSESLIWRMQRRFFAEQGLAAWATSTVPHYVTNNPTLADAYARLVLAQLRDRAHTPGAASRRTHIIELGAGSGRFAHNFLRQFLPRLEAAGLGTPVTYVLTDTVPELIAHWRAHPRFRPYVELGVLDFALFDAETPAPLVLVESQRVLAPGTLESPAIVFANYVFDSLPSDCFRARAGALCEGLVTLRSEHEVADASDPALLPVLELAMSERAVTLPYYADPVLDAILSRYAERLDEASFLVPHIAVRCLEFLRSLGRALFAVIADRGVGDEVGLQNRPEPVLSLNGSFSLAVNFDALGKYARLRGGAMFQTSHRSPRLEVVALTLDPQPTMRETSAAFRESVGEGGPADTYFVKQALEPHYETFTLEQLLSYLRLSHWDSNVFWRAYPALVRQAAPAPDALKDEVRRAVVSVWNAYFSIGEPEDLALLIATLHYAIGDYADARRYLEHSQTSHGERAVSLFNLALCSHRLGESARAHDELARVLELDPAFPAARELRSILERSTAP